MIRTLLAITFASLLAGCATQNLSFSQLAAQLPPLPVGDGQIYVYRSNGYVGSGQTDRIFINDQQIGPARFGAGEFFYVDQPAGDCVVEPKHGLLNLDNLLAKHLKFTLAAGETKYVRITEHFLGGVDATVEDRETATKVLSEMLL